MTTLTLVKNFLNSLPGQFLIGGLTVMGIAFFSNNISNTAIAGVIAGVPIGMPSTIFVEDNKAAAYMTNLLYATFILLFVTTLNWYLVAKKKINKYKSVGISMGTWVLLSVIFVLVRQ